MRFLVDESTGLAVANYLRTQGHDVVAVSEVMAQADDTDILRQAFVEERIVVTNDKDFGDLVFRSGQPHHGVILLRLRDESHQNRVRVIASVLAEYADWLPNRFAVATEKNVRFRPTLA